MDFWRHLRDELGSFPSDGILAIEFNGGKPREVSNKALEDYPSPGRGIFGGAFLCWAKLRFSAERAR